MEFDGITFRRDIEDTDRWVSDYLNRGTTALEDAMLTEIERLTAELAALREAHTDTKAELFACQMRLAAARKNGEPAP